MCLNLIEIISMVDLDDLGLYGKIEDGMVKVKNWSLFIFKEVKRNGIYVTRLKLYLITLLKPLVLNLIPPK